MNKEDEIIRKFGLCPSQSDYIEIKQLLSHEIQNHDDDEGCGEYLRVLCFMIFYLGHVEDCELIWEAKNLNMDTGCYIDVGLLCGAGYDETIVYASDKEHLNDMKSYIIHCHDCHDTFDRETIISDYNSSFGAAEQGRVI